MHEGGTPAPDSPARTRLLDTSPPRTPGDSPCPSSHAPHTHTGTEDSFTVQQALDSKGFGAWQAMLLVYSGLFWAADAMEIMLLSYIGSAAKCEWSLSSEQESMLSSAVFAGMLIGACLWGAVADTLGRTKAGLAMAAVILACGLLSAAAPNYLALVAARTGVGFGLAGTSTQYTLFMEWLPLKSRGRWLVLINFWWTAGTAAEVLLAWAVLNSLGWRWLVGLSAVPFAVLLVLIPLVPDSAQLVIAQGDAPRAHRLLLAAAKFNGKALPTGRLQPCSSDTADAADAQESPSPGDGEGERGHGAVLGRGKAALRLLVGDLGRVLRDKSSVLTLAALSLVWLAAAFNYYGMVMLAAELSASLDGGGGEAAPSGDASALCTGPGGRVQLEGTMFWHVLLDASAELPSLLFCLWAVGSATAARYPVVSRSFYATALALSVLTVHPAPRGPALQLSLFASRLFAMAAFTVLYILTPELLPTRIRACVLGVCNAVSRLGGLLAPFAAVALVQHGQLRASALVFMSAACAAALATSFVGVRTAGREMKVQPSAEALRQPLTI